MTRRRLLAALFIVVGAVAAVLAQPADDPAIYGGVPKAASLGQRWSTHVLRNPGFTVGYSEWRRQALWVAYRASSAHAHRLGPRPDHFSADARVLVQVTSQNYTHSGYDRGHLAPNYIIGKLYGAEAQRATFLMSNISPQSARLNALVWQRLEEAEADDVAPAAHDLWVVTGPLFAADAPALRSGIAVPEAFYRIWIDTTPAPRLLAFVVPQQVCGTEPLSGYLASVDEIERRTGLDFFAELDDAVEERLEGGVASDGWSLARFDRRAPRYAEHFGRLKC
jgi:endonuclease G, mitochondrial